MQKIFKIFSIAILCALSAFLGCCKILAVSSTSQTTAVLQVSSEACNNNGICEDDEDETFCFNDCGCNNNGVCEIERLETELSCPADCGEIPAPEKEGGRGEYNMYVAGLKISNITFDSAQISWKTTRSAKCSVYLGKTSGYEIETVSETEYSENHNLKFSDLDISTGYHFNVYCADAGNLDAETGDKIFMTLAAINNVSNFLAVAGEKNIILTWKNPSDYGFDSVSVLRNSEFYPFSVDDGTVIYQGNGEEFVDEAVQVGKDYYYSIFAKTKNGQLSSGAIAQAKIQESSQEQQNYSSQENLEEKSQNSQSQEEASSESILRLKLVDFDFYSDNQKISITGKNTIELTQEKDFTISINAEKIPQDHKKIIVKIDGQGGTSYYLFSPNSSKTVYSASIVGLENSGKYTLTISFYGNRNSFLYSIDGKLSILQKGISDVKNKFADFVELIEEKISWPMILIVLLILLIIIVLRRKK